MSGKKKTVDHRQTSPRPLQPAACPRAQRRAPTTPPLPLKALHLVAKQPETSVVLRDRGKFKGHVSAIRDSWPGAGPKSSDHQPRMTQRSLAPPSWASSTTINQPALSNNSCVSTRSPHWSVPIRAPPTGLGCQANLTSLLLFFHR